MKGGNLVASETGTWMAEHFTETLGEMKALVDDLFLSGVNHVFYHGTCYSPDEAGWPGWVFYASTQMNPRNSIWRDAPALNDYVARCQSILQSGRSDNDVLLYWPVYDYWNDATNRLPTLQVESQQIWFEISPSAKPRMSSGTAVTPSTTFPTGNCSRPKSSKDKCRCPAGIITSSSCRSVGFCLWQPPKDCSLGQVRSKVTFQDHLPMAGSGAKI